MTEQNNASYTVDSLKTNLKNRSYLLGLVGALLGALIGAIPWAVVYSFGWFVGWLGFLIGFCAAAGYRILRGKSGWLAILIIVFAIIFGVAAGQTMGDFIDIGKYISRGELDGFTYSDIPRLYFFLLANDSEALSSTLVNLVLGLLFAFLGVWRMIASMIADLKGSKQNTTAFPVPEQAMQTAAEQPAQIPAEQIETAQVWQTTPAQAEQPAPEQPEQIS